MSVVKKAVKRRSHPTSDAILDAAERLMVSAAQIDDVSTRRVAELAGTGVSAVNYHFESREKLIIAVVRRVYLRFNAERLQGLRRAVDAHAPNPPELRAVIAALVEPSLRWSFDPNSSYAVFVHFAAMRERIRNEAIRSSIYDNHDHVMQFVPVLRRCAPWFSDGEIGWRVHCALGIRDVVVRDPLHRATLAAGAFDTSDPDQLLEHMVDVIAAMFARP